MEIENGSTRIDKSRAPTGILNTAIFRHALRDCWGPFICNQYSYTAWGNDGIFCQKNLIVNTAKAYCWVLQSDIFNMLVNGISIWVYDCSGEPNSPITQFGYNRVFYLIFQVFLLTCFTSGTKEEAFWEDKLLKHPFSYSACCICGSLF